MLFETKANSLRAGSARERNAALIGLTAWKQALSGHESTINIVLDACKAWSTVLRGIANSGDEMQETGNGQHRRLGTICALLLAVSALESGLRHNERGSASPAQRSTLATHSVAIMRAHQLVLSLRLKWKPVQCANGPLLTPLLCYRTKVALARGAGSLARSH